MNEDTLKLLSAYLDNAATPAERQTVEALLQQDHAAREELEALRVWNQEIKAAAPPSFQTPAGFRQKIMQRLDAPGDLPPKMPGGGSVPPWLITGTVLVGLVGGMLYYDSTQNRGKVQAPAENPTSKALVPSDGQGLATDQPVYRGQTNDPANKAGVVQSEISGRSALANQGANQTAPGLPLEGSVFVSGQGSFRQSKNPGTLTGQPAIEIPARTGESPSPVNRLEQYQDWTRADVQALYRRSTHSPAFPAEEILRWSRQYQLNPGLIVAATLIQEPFVPEATLPIIRHELDASAGQTESERLRRISVRLAGPGSSPEAWKTFLNKPE